MAGVELARPQVYVVAFDHGHGTCEMEEGARLHWTPSHRARQKKIHHNHPTHTNIHQIRGSWHLILIYYGLARATQRRLRGWWWWHELWW